MTKREAIEAVCFGEILFDRFPDGDHLGGAPLNFAWYLRQFGVQAAMVSAVGRDALGDRALVLLAGAGIDARWVVRRPEPTGVVNVTLTSGQPSYEIRRGVAWDHIELNDGQLARGALLYFGTLAQRTPSNRNTLKRLCENPFEHRFFDVNLRQQYYTEALLREGFAGATVVKLNAEEWQAVSRMLHTESGEAFVQAFRLQALIVTKGAEGADLYAGGRRSSAGSPAVEVVDAVGAGDAFSAVMAAALVKGVALDRALPRACEVGAFVVGHRGAQVDIPAALRGL